MSLMHEAPTCGADTVAPSATAPQHGYGHDSYLQISIGCRNRITGTCMGHNLPPTPSPAPASGVQAQGYIHRNRLPQLPSPLPRYPPACSILSAFGLISLRYAPTAQTIVCLNLLEWFWLQAHAMADLVGRGRQRGDFARPCSRCEGIPGGLFRG